MKNILLDIIKGVLIGVANVIPGVSGGTIAVSTGIYEKMINAINNLRKEFKQSIKILWPILLGVVIGIVGLSFVITFLLDKYPAPTTACFIGLVLGGVPVLYRKIINEKIKWTHNISFLIMLIIIIVPSIIAVNTNEITSVELDFINISIFVLLGIVSATAMVVPGISGSMILMMLGYYEIVISTIKDTISQIAHLNFQEAINGILLMIPFGVGVIFGIIIITKIISTILKKWPLASTWGILGLVVASPFAIIIKLGQVTINPFISMISIATFAIGFLISFKLGEK